MRCTEKRLKGDRKGRRSDFIQILGAIKMAAAVSAGKLCTKAQNRLQLCQWKCQEIQQEDRALFLFGSSSMFPRSITGSNFSKVSPRGFLSRAVTASRPLANNILLSFVTPALSVTF